MTAPSIQIYTGQDFYVPAFMVRLQDQPLGNDVVSDIVQVSYQDSVDTIDSCSLTVNNWDAESLSFKYSDGDLFNPGKKIELWMGYLSGDGLRLMMAGKLTSMQPSFPAAGQPTLTVSGQNQLHHLRGEQRNRGYEKLKASEIARQVAGRMQVELRTDPQAEAKESPYDHIRQDNEYDIVFLMKLAEEHGYELYVEERGHRGSAEPSKLYFGPPQRRKIVYELNYGSTEHYGASLIEFQPSLITSAQVEQVVLNGWDGENRCRISYTSQFASLESKPLNVGSDAATIGGSFARRGDRIGHRPVNSPQEARRIASQTHERINRQMLTASGSTIGLPALRAGCNVRINGVGKRFSGAYFVTATTHTLSDSGYTTRFEARREGP